MRGELEKARAAYFAKLATLREEPGTVTGEGAPRGDAVGKDSSWRREGCTALQSGRSVFVR